MAKACRRTLTGPLLLAASLCLLVSLVPALAAGARPNWVASWSSAQQIPEPHNALPPDKLAGATLRQVVRPTLAGSRLRLRISNLFGTAPLAIGGVHVARSADRASARIDPGSDRPVTFSGRSAILIPAGAEYVSDPVDLPVTALAHLAVTLHLPTAPVVQTGHPGSRATSYLLKGSHLAAPDLPAAEEVVHWYQLAAVEVSAGPRARAVVTLGDSITDGFGVRPDTDQRWPDFLAERLQGDPRTRDVAVLNHGIGGNRLLLDGLGPNGLARFERDMLAAPGVRYLVMLIGVNDLGSLTREAPADDTAHRDLVERMTSAYAQIVERARSRGIKVIGATITPYGGSEYYHPNARNEADRQALNAWIRAPGNVDAVADFDTLLHDRARPDRLAPDYDSGDHLHPSISGYRAIAASLPLAFFADPAPASAPQRKPASRRR